MAYPGAPGRGVRACTRARRLARDSRSAAQDGTHDDRHEGGQGLAEFALVLPILALLFAAVIQFALIFETQIGITNAVREAARRAASQPTSTTNVDTNGTWARSQLGTLLGQVQQYGSANLISAQVCYAPVTDPAGATKVAATVPVRYGHPLWLPLMSALIDGIDGSADGKADVTTAVTIQVQESSTSVSGCYS